MNTSILEFINKALDVCESQENKHLLVAIGTFALRDYIQDYNEFAPRSGDRALASDLVNRYPMDSLMKEGSS